jgi:hypothetical protein
LAFSVSAQSPRRSSRQSSDPWPGTLPDAEQNDFESLADEYATVGGLNEQFLTALRSAGIFNVVGRALDDVAHRLGGG